MAAIISRAKLYTESIEETCYVDAGAGNTVLWAQHRDQAPSRFMTDGKSAQRRYCNNEVRSALGHL